MNSGKKITALIGTAAAVLLVVSGCSGGLLSGGGGDSDSGSKGDIKIGMVAPTSGSSAPTGAYMVNGAKLAVAEINDDGGIDGRKLKLLVEDGACDAQQAVAAANKLVSSGVKASVGGYCSGATLPTLPIFETANIPMIIPAANSQDLVKQGLKNVFLINGTGLQQSTAALKFIKKQGYDTVALVDDNTSYSVDIATETQKQIEADGAAKVVLKTSVTAGESDYSSVVNTIMSKSPALVYWTGYYQEGGLIINQLKQAGFKGEIMVADGSVDASLAKIAGSGAEGVFATMTQTPDTLTGADAEKWIANYKKKFNAEPGPYSTQSYDAVRVAAEAIKKAGNTNGDDMIKALEGIDGFKLFSGPLKFTSEHTLSSGGFIILEMKDGKFVLKDSLS